MMKRALGLAVAAALVSAAAPVDQAQPVDIVVHNLRSLKGNILICIAREARYFPDCSKDPAQRHLTVRAGPGPISLGSLPPGDYAIAIIHDENGNGKLDTFAGIPKEGVGFSRNPALRFGAPSFSSAQFPVMRSAVRQDVKLKYFL